MSIPPADLRNVILIGATICDRYLIEAPLQGGGMGMVYRARHVVLGKPVAIKIAREAQDGAARQRFLLEARSASLLNHPNIVDITDFGVLPDGRPFLVMELLRGQTLGEVLHAGPVAPLRACRIAAQITRGLQAVHDQGIVHRDLKPDNILLLQRDREQDFVKIVDFGIAKVGATPQVPPNAWDPAALSGGPPTRLTQDGLVLGTPAYMAPEQAMGAETDHRVDQYALGCILYEMLTGALPFGEHSAQRRHVSEPVVPPRQRRPDLCLPSSLEAVVLRAMAKDRGARFPQMAALEQALLREEELLATRGMRPPPPAVTQGTGALAPSGTGHGRPLFTLPVMALCAALVTCIFGLCLQGFGGAGPLRHGTKGVPVAAAFARPAAALSPAPGPPPRPARPPQDPPRSPLVRSPLSQTVPLHVRFDIRNRNVEVTISCGGQPVCASPAGTSCLVEVNGRGGCEASARGFRTQTFPYSTLRACGHDDPGKTGCTKVVDLDPIWTSP